MSTPVEAQILPPRYRSPKRIARGGMGEIYRATDATLGRAVAVKILSERYSLDEAIRQRFTREALAAARLSGEPNIITIYDVGERPLRPRRRRLRAPDRPPTVRGGERDGRGRGAREQSRSVRVRPPGLA